MDEREELKKNISKVVKKSLWEYLRSFIDTDDMAEKIVSLLPAPKMSGVVRVRKATQQEELLIEGSGEIETELTDEELCEWARDRIEGNYLGLGFSVNLPDGSRLRLKK